MKAVALALLLSGCGVFSLAPPERPRAAVGSSALEAVETATAKNCARLNDEHLGWAVTGIVTGALAGGSGLASILTGTASRYVTAGLGVGLSISAGTSALLSSLYAARYSQECAQGGTP